jgi:hypothetical protein
MAMVVISVVNLNDLRPFNDTSIEEQRKGGIETVTNGQDHLELTRQILLAVENSLSLNALATCLWY